MLKRAADISMGKAWPWRSLNKAGMFWTAASRLNFSTRCWRSLKLVQMLRSSEVLPMASCAS
jgi:hypothetical protein